MQSIYFKKGISFLSTSPLSYAVELTAESPIFYSGFGCSLGIHPLADCVKSALTLLLGIKICSSFCRHNTVLTRARLKHTLTPNAPFLTFPCECRWNRLRSTAQAVSYYESRALLTVGKQSKIN